MRNKLIILTVLAALTLPSSAFAGRRDRAQPREADPVERRSDGYSGHQQARGFITITNPNEAALKVRIDGERIGRVMAGETLRVGPFEPGEHRVVTRYVDRDLGLRQRISDDVVRIDRRHPARLVLPRVDMAVVEVANHWIEPMSVVVDAQVVGTVPAEGTMVLLANTDSRVALLGSRGEKPLRTRVVASGLAAPAG